ncbi:MAG: LysR substrate-binding domain-containing protein, partial [Eubacteriales bacterium]
KILHENHLVFSPLFEATAHVFISQEHPLAGQSSISPDMLGPYPFLAFEQGTYNSFYFSEEPLSTLTRKKIIHVSDRATLFNLLIGLNGYTICSGILNSDLNGNQIISVPLETDETMLIGWIAHEKSSLTTTAREYLDELKKLITQDGYELL